MSRDIKDLSPRMQIKVITLEAALANAGLGHFKKSCTYRSQQEQNVIWKQGRASLIEVNAARETVNMAPLTEKQNKKVTWRSVSIHTDREAVDYYVLKDGKYCEDLKVDIDKDDIPDWQEFGAIAESCGLEWGGRWTHPDYPHLQWKD